MAKSSALTGFPEWLPEQELVQQHLIALVRHQFELNGFAPLLLRSVEQVEDLLSKGETDKEIYGLTRLADRGGDQKIKLGLHYDLTVPFARYVGDNRGRLTFPFRRYQIQPAWRGERPQLGRYREFLQADIDIIGSGKLDVRYDGEMIRILQSVMSALPIPNVRLLINNRKVLEGFYRGIGIEKITEVLRIVDKLDKIGEDGVAKALGTEGITDEQVTKCLALARIEAKNAEELEAIRKLGSQDDELEAGLAELAVVLGACRQGPDAAPVVAAMRIARGFDYYTGTVVEGVFIDHPDFGSVCSGGRYDNLASGGSTPLPGMGVSIGITRIMGLCLSLGMFEQPRKSPADVMVIVHSDETREASENVAAALRARDIKCIVSDAVTAYGKQIKKASQLGIPYVWFPAGEAPDAVKCIVSGEQIDADLDTWVPDASVTALKI